ncbi:MAG TPA: alpha/beta hydrolase [Rhizomicrobium sp.]|jgi:acetyl esterase/lipase|nr:alpha/beta hydrolase [Rhizomicrobium sp.]
MDRRSVLGLGALALAGAALPSRAADVPSSDRLPGDPAEIVPLWPKTPPGGKGVHLKLDIFERSPTPELFRDRAVTDIQEPVLTVFRPDKPDGSALLLAPGGGYKRVVIDKEGFEAARRLNGAGVTVFVLRYRLPFEGWANGPDVPLQDAQRAMRLIRARAGEFAVDPRRVGVLGFSAGGHVAASLITRFDAKVYAPADAIDKQDARPDFAGLMYPVVSMIPPIAHAGSREKLLGADPGAAQQAAYSCERLVTARTPPTFLALAADDKEVDPQNSLAMAASLRGAGVPSELHMFEEGGHGFGLRLAQGRPAAIWPDLLLRWGARHGAFKNVTL